MRTSSSPSGSRAMPIVPVEKRTCVSRKCRSQSSMARKRLSKGTRFQRCTVRDTPPTAAPWPGQTRRGAPRGASRGRRSSPTSRHRGGRWSTWSGWGLLEYWRRGPGAGHGGRMTVRWTEVDDRSSMHRSSLPSGKLLVHALRHRQRVADLRQPIGLLPLPFQHAQLAGEGKPLVVLVERESRRRGATPSRSCRSPATRSCP